MLSIELIVSWISKRSLPFQFLTTWPCFIINPCLRILSTSVSIGRYWMMFVQFLGLGGVISGFGFGVSSFGLTIRVMEGFRRICDILSVSSVVIADVIVTAGLESVNADRWFPILESNVRLLFLGAAPRSELEFVDPVSVLEWLDVTSLFFVAKPYQLL